jgi:type VI secretion system protein ImpK
VKPPIERWLPLVEPVLAAARIASGPDVRPEAARALLEDRFRVLRAAAQRERLPTRDTDDVVYALAAHADELMLARPGLREAWLPRLLQLAFFGENTAGEGFFVRLDPIRRDASRADVLFVYWLVLSLGLKGRYATREAARLELVESVHLDLLRAGGETDVALAPHALPARSEPRARLDPRWALALGALACVLAVLTWGALALELAVHTGRALGG